MCYFYNEYQRDSKTMAGGGEKNFGRYNSVRLRNKRRRTITDN